MCSFQIDPTHSIFLLGQEQASFKPYFDLIKQLSSLGQFLSFDTSAEWLSCYERDSQQLYAKLPLLAFQPNCTPNILPFIKACQEKKISVTTRCGGTGLAGGCVPNSGGVLLLTGHLKNVIEYDSKSGKIRVEPGISARELNRYVRADGWIFPLEMSSEGVVGLAGCLSSYARGYDQQEQALYETIENVRMVDGYGNLIDIPSSLVCGAEGLLGVITEITLQLKRGFTYSYTYMLPLSWQEILSHESFFRSIPCLKSLVYYQNQFYVRLKGEKWRVMPSCKQIEANFSSIQAFNRLDWPHFLRFMAKKKPFMIISSVLFPSQLPEACLRAKDLAQEFEIDCQIQADVLAGSLQIIIESHLNAYSFSQKAEQFLVIWADFLDQQKGVLASCHGIGMQMRAYMTPFWDEELQSFFRKLQKEFDPAGLFCRDRFFPTMGKSLERVRNENN